MRRSAGLATALVALACMSCSTTPNIGPANGEPPGGEETACLVRGLGGPITSYVEAGRKALEALGFRVVVNDAGVSSEALEPCGVIVAHSAGAVPALGTRGGRLIFIIDGFASLLHHCPAVATCINFYNPGDLLGGPLAGARNINCLTSCGLLDKIPLVAHETMPASPAVWAAILSEIEQRGFKSARAQEVSTSLP